MLIDQIKCNHLDKPLEFIKNIHGDEINYLNARSIWKCPDCGKIIMRSQPYEKIEQYKVLDLQKENKIKKLKEKTSLLEIVKSKGYNCIPYYYLDGEYLELNLNPEIVVKINQLVDAVNELKGKA